MIYVNRKNNKTIRKEKNEYSQKEKTDKNITVPAAFLSLLFFAMLLIFPAQVSEGTLHGINLCLETLLPSLFPFMFVSALFSSSAGTRNKAGKADRFFQKLLGLNFFCVKTLVLAAFGGYPVGAVTVNSLYKKGVLTETQARRMVYTAFGSGMGFLVSYTGACLLSSRRTGLLLFFSQLITVFLMAVITGIFFRTHNSKNISALPEQNGTEVSSIDRKEKSVFSVIFNSALSAGKSAFNMCLIVVLFSSVLGITSRLLSYNSFLRDVFTAVWEVSGGVKAFAGKYPLWLLGVITGFGGVCVHLQVYSAAKDISFSKFLFFLFRVLQGIINGCVVYGMTILFPYEEQTAGVFSSVTEKPVPEAAESPLKFIILIFVCFCFLFSLGQKLYTPKALPLLKEKINLISRR